MVLRSLSSFVYNAFIELRSIYDVQSPNVSNTAIKGSILTICRVGLPTVSVLDLPSFYSRFSVLYAYTKFNDLIDYDVLPYGVMINKKYIPAVVVNVCDCPVAFDL